MARESIDTKRDITAGKYVAGICEDAPADLDKIYDILRKELSADWEIRLYSDGDSLRKDLEQGVRFTVLYLDIFLEDDSGMELARRVKEISPDTELVFITESREFAVEAFALQALHYIVKPVTEEALRESVERGRKKHRNVPDAKLYIKTNRELLTVDESSIIYVQSDNQKTKLILKDQPDILTYTPFYKIETQLSPVFVKLKRGILINMRYIDVMGADYCALSNGTEFELGRNHRARVHQEYEDYIFSELAKRKEAD